MMDNNNSDALINDFFNTNQDIDNKIQEQKSQENIILGIDLGTSNTCVAIWRNNNCEIIPDEFGNQTFPSIVAYTNKNRYIGCEAKNQKELNPKNVFYEVKRLIGRKITDECIQNERELLNYDISSDKEDNILLLSEYKKYTPEEISASILSKAKLMAENYLECEISKAVITCPAYFNDSQRQATKDAATISGLECLRIINEPTASALAYGLLSKSEKYKNKSMNIMVYDLGGGTLDVSLLTITDGIFEVLASVGNTRLGGADFDNRILKYCIKYFMTKNNLENINEISSLSLQKLRKSCENAKILLSTNNMAIIAVKDFYMNKDLLIKLKRDKFYELCRDLLLLCMKPIEDVLLSCNMKKENIDEILLVGGMTQMLIIKENIKNYFNKEPNCSVDPNLAVAIGASIQAYIMGNHKDPLIEDIMLLDIIPLSLGVETMGGVMSTIIKRNTYLPVTKKKIYSTDQDFCDSVLIKVFEGERKMTKNNFLVGEFELSNIEKVPRGIPEIEVKFHVDINGIIQVTAEDLKNNNKKTITITGNKGRLKQEDIKKLILEAKEYELKDKLEKNKKTIYYNIEELYSNININLNNDEYKIGQKEKEVINEDLQKIKNWLNEKNYLLREETELRDMLKYIKNKYGTLILRVNKLDENIKSADNNSKGTNIYDDEEENTEVFEQVEDLELGINNMENQEKQELKNIRNQLMELCNSVYEVLPNLNIKDEDKKDLRDYIDDTLLWIHIQQKVNKQDLQLKIEEVNNNCNKLFNEYSENIFVNKSKKEELYEMCMNIKNILDNNMFEVDCKDLNDIIKLCLDNIENLEETKIEELINNINDLFGALYYQTFNN
jgi:molecular chaperone DnaK (HSP70)